MPVKRRTAKRRIDPAVDYPLWSGIFDAGYDYFGDLPEAGVPTDAHGRPDQAHALAAWQRHGAAFLDARGARDGRGEPWWALEQFGEPHHAR